MNVERRLSALEGRRHDRPAPGRRLTVSEIDLVLATFEPSDRVLSTDERTEAERLIASCRTGMSEAELDAALLEFVHFPELEIETC